MNCYRVRDWKRPDCLGHIRERYGLKCSKECKFTAYCVWESLIKRQEQPKNSKTMGQDNG